MILRPVRPESPSGPPTTKRPVGLIRNWVERSIIFAGMTFLITYSMRNSRMSECFTLGVCCVEMTTFSTLIGRSFS